MVKLNELDEQDRQVSGLIASAHNHSLQQGMMYARAIDALEQRTQRIQSAFVAEQSKAKQLGDEVASVREKVAIIEVERDDLRAELCTKRTEIDSINVQVLRLAEALKVADEQVVAKGMLLEMGEQEIAELKVMIERTQQRQPFDGPATFRECAECASKPGSVILCPSCFSNRLALSQHEQEIAELKVTIDLLTLPKAADEYEMTPEQAAVLIADQAEAAGTRG